MFPEFLKHIQNFIQYKANLAGGPATWSTKTKGLVTGTRVRVLPGGETLVNPMAWTVNYYDDFGRVVQTISDNHFETNSKEVVHSKYNFSGQLKKRWLSIEKGTALPFKPLPLSMPTTTWEDC